ncbi:MAG: capsule assembly Wzi family protein [Mucilaginibacter sp.]|uniref:capsule assembly Wzi family protein n=1 Tax=Mucilaginibacter sp. TaxID=1882438 RepID=UPI0034E57135
MKRLVLSFVFILISYSGFCQFADSLQVNAGSIGTVAKDGYQPLWLVANRWGAITDQQYDASTYIGFNNTHVFGKKYVSKSNLTNIEQPLFYVKYGANIINNNRFQNVIFQEGYVKAGYKHLEIRYGRFKDIPGESDKNLSSGSLGVSGNALPIPKIGIALTDYVNVPFTNGWLQIKGQLSHGWLGRDRYLDSYYHEKTLYLRAGKRKFKFFAGLQHYVEWGGKRDGIQLDRSFKGYLNVFFSTTNADDGSGFDPNAAKYAAYHAGDQRGVLEFGFDLETEKNLLHFYHQTPFDDTWGVDVRNVDNLSGLSITPKKEGSFVKKLLFEFIYTKTADSYAPPENRQAYYNNGYYRTGWEYDGQIVGTPLFINRTRGQDYTYFQQRGIKPFDWSNNNIPGNNNIIYNQIVGGHIGLSLQFSNKLSGKTLLTYTSGQFQNNGPNLGQFYSLQEMYYRVSKSLKVSAGFALDAGDFSHNVGGLVGVHWQFRNDGQFKF